MITSSYIPKIPPILTDIEYYILLAILTTPRHGIGIFEEVARATDNQLVLSPGTLYAALKRMFATSWIRMVEPSEAGYEPDERRKIYVATEEGSRAIEEKTAWFERELERAHAALAKRAEIEPPTSSGSSQSSQGPSHQGNARSNTSHTSEGNTKSKSSSLRSIKKP